MTIGIHVASRNSETYDTTIKSKTVRQHWEDISNYKLFQILCKEQEILGTK